MPNTSATGQAGEQVAAKYLQAQGFDILAMNFTNDRGRRKGEIDIIAKEDKEYVFVEVKTRRSARYYDSLPEENITYAKLHKLARIADEYLQQHDMRAAAYRFDAVSVWLDDRGATARIKHLRNIYL